VKDQEIKGHDRGGNAYAKCVDGCRYEQHAGGDAGAREGGARIGWNTIRPRNMRWVDEGVGCCAKSSIALVWFQGPRLEQMSRFCDSEGWKNGAQADQRVGLGAVEKNTEIRRES